MTFSLIPDTGSLSPTREAQKAQQPQPLDDELERLEQLAASEIARQHEQDEPDDITRAEAHAAAVELGRRTGKYAQPTTDVIAEARRMRDEEALGF